MHSYLKACIIYYVSLAEIIVSVIALIATNPIFGEKTLKIRWASAQENLSLGFGNNTGTDQPAQTDQCLCYSFFGTNHIQTCYR